MPITVTWHLCFTAAKDRRADDSGTVASPAAMLTNPMRRRQRQRPGAWGPGDGGGGDGAASAAGALQEDGEGNADTDADAAEPTTKLLAFVAGGSNELDAIRQAVAALLDDNRRLRHRVGVAPTRVRQPPSGRGAAAAGAAASAAHPPGAANGMLVLSVAPRRASDAATETSRRPSMSAVVPGSPRNRQSFPAVHSRAAHTGDKQYRSTAALRFAALRGAKPASGRGSAASPAPTAAAPPRSPKSPPAHASLGSLPPGWRQAKDPATGRTYFFHATTKETCWKLP